MTPAGFFKTPMALAGTLVLLLASSSVTRAQTPPPPQPLPQPTFTVTVIETAPLPGVNLPVEKVPAPAQTASDRDIRESGALDLSDFMNRRLNGVHVNEIQGNPFQPDVNYRGYTASPLLGTPQGLSVYMDGVRLNQPFGEIVSWDLIPRMAIASTTLMPGSNPLFGLNTLGGALSIQTKSGLSARGTSIQSTYGTPCVPWRLTLELRGQMPRARAVKVPAGPRYLTGPPGVQPLDGLFFGQDTIPACLASYLRPI